MLTALLQITLGALAFVPQELPSTVSMYKSYFEDNILLVVLSIDIDGDGLQDLVTSSGVLLQRDGLLGAAVPWPGPPEGPAPEVDSWDRDLYLRYPDRLEVIRWEGGVWQKTLVQPVSWPDSTPTEPEDVEEEGSNKKEEPQFERFLQDIDGNNVPEIILGCPDGLHVYARRGESYQQAGVVDVYPPVRLGEWTRWRGGYRFDGATRYMHGALLLNGPVFTVMSQEIVSRDESKFHITGFAWKVDDNGIRAEKTSEVVTATMPGPLMWPERLNGDDVVDFAGFDLEDSPANPMVPVLVFSVSTDSGKTVQTVRIRGRLEPWRVDVEGDGDLDLIVPRLEAFEGGFREILTRAFTDKRVEYQLQIHLQDSHGHFSDDPDIRWKGRMELDRTPAHQSSQFLNGYLSGDAIRFADCNGDKRIDLIVQDWPDRIDVYLGTSEGFESKPSATVPAKADARFDVHDVDGDKRADIVVPVTPKSSAGCIYFSREVRP